MRVRVGVGAARPPPATGTTPVPGRPIVSGNGSPTEKISKFVDFFINPLCRMLPSYLKDTTHLLQILHDLGPMQEGTLLVTLDVCSLFQNKHENPIVH